MATTLLDIVQDILGELNSDSVNSISDTIEAQSVASIVRQAFKDIVTEMDLPGKKNLVTLQGLSDLTKPNIMKIPDEVSKILWIKYDVRISVSSDRQYADMRYMEPMDFVEYVNGNPNTDTTTFQTVMWTANLPLTINKTIAPTYWTSFDDTYIVFDSYNNVVDSTLQTSKSMAEGYSEPTLTLTDTAVPDLPQNLGRLLYHTSLNRACHDLKREPNQKGERNESRFRVRAQRNKWREGRMTDDYPDYGRR